jgi:hypothetical protein
MARFAYRSGNGSEIITPKADGKPDETPRRRTSRMHLSAAADASASWRVLAHLADGGEVLLCLGATRAEAVNAAKARCAAAEVPETARRLAIERWQGARLAGTWVEVKAAKGELPRLPRRPMRRSRLMWRG